MEKMINAWNKTFYCVHDLGRITATRCGYHSERLIIHQSHRRLIQARDKNLDLKNYSWIPNVGKTHWRTAWRIIVSVPKLKMATSWMLSNSKGLTDNHQKNVYYAIFGEKARDSWRVCINLTAMAVLLSAMARVFTCSRWLAPGVTNWFVYILYKNVKSMKG